MVPPARNLAPSGLGELVCLTVDKRGAKEVIRRLRASKTKPSGRQMAAAAGSFPCLSNESAHQLQALYEPAPTRINVSAPPPVMVPPTRSLVLVGLSAALAC
jgi:hypothetical protein